MELMKLADGRMFDPITKTVVGENVDAPSEEQTQVPQQEVTISPVVNSSLRVEDLPATPKTMNVVMAILGYRNLGLVDSEVAFALGCTVEQLQVIAQSDAFMRTEKMVTEAFSKAQLATAEGTLHNAALDAARTVTTKLKSKDDSIALRAAESVLNRVGLSDASANKAGGLTIRVVKDTKHTDISINVGA